NLAAAKNRLKIVTDGARQQERQQAELEIQRAQAESDQARAFYDRRVTLLQRGITSREDMEEARLRWKVAAAALRTAHEKQNLLVEGARTEEVRVAEQAVTAAEQALREAKADRARKSISDEDIKSAQAQLEQAEATEASARA